MKQHIVRLANLMLSPLNAKLVRRKPSNENPDLSMGAVLQRLAQRPIPIQTVIDIGASNGQWSVACMGHFPQASYLAVEPLAERQPELEANKQKFPNFDYALCVAGATDGQTAQLNVSPDLDGSTVNGEGSGTSRPCPVRTIDSLVAQKGLKGAYLLKFDTHGYEIPILKGCEEVLSRTAAILMETYNFQLTPDSLRFHEMCLHLEQLGFRPVDLAAPMLRLYDEAFWQVDILFLKSDADTFKHHKYR